MNGAVDREADIRARIEQHSEACFAAPFLAPAGRAALAETIPAPKSTSPLQPS